MKEFWSILNNKKKLKQACKERSLKELEAASEKLSSIIDELKLDEEMKLKREEESKAAVLSALATLEGAGLSVDDVIATLESTKEKKKKRAYKYQYEVDGKNKRWSGVGSVPKQLQEKLDAGAKLEDFAI